MLGFGTKKPPSLDRFPIDNWAVAKAQSLDAPMILRINSGARKYIAHPELSTRLGVTVGFNARNEHGFCTPEEGQQLSQIEDRLTAELMKNQNGFPVLVVTCDGKREFVFYVHDKQQASQAVDLVRDAVTTHALTHGMEYDAEWSYYKQFENVG